MHLNGICILRLIHDKIFEFSGYRFCNKWVAHQHLPSNIISVGLIGKTKSKISPLRVNDILHPFYRLPILLIVLLPF